MHDVASKVETIHTYPATANYWAPLLDEEDDEDDDDETPHLPIINNINDIVAGATQVGSSVNELLIGTLTTITNIPENSSEVGSQPSTDFVVSGIKGAEQGVAETSQARFDLNTNNHKLVTAYKNLAQINALVTAAKIIQVQTNFFNSALNDAFASLQKIGQTWGQSPQNPPSSGISQEFSNFANAINSIVSQIDADTFAGQLDYAETDWNLFNQKLFILRQILNGTNNSL